MGLFRPAKVVRQTGRAAPTNFLGYILLFLAMATGTAAWSKWPAASVTARLLSPQDGAWRLRTARHAQGEARPLVSQPLPPERQFLHVWHRQT